MDATASPAGAAAPLDLAAAAARMAQLAQEAIERAARQSDRLEKMAEMGMRVLEALAAQAAGDPSTEPEPAKRRFVSHDDAMLFMRVANSIRHVIALQFRIDGNARDQAHRAIAEEVRRAKAARDPLRGEKDLVCRIVEGSLTTVERGAAERAMRAIETRLDDPEIEAQFGARSIAGIVAELCHEQGIVPNLEPWSSEVLGLHGELRPMGTPRMANGVQPPPQGPP